MLKNYISEKKKKNLHQLHFNTVLILNSPQFAQYSSPNKILASEWYIYLVLIYNIHKYKYAETYLGNSSTSEFNAVYLLSTDFHCCNLIKGFMPG